VDKHFFASLFPWAFTPFNPRAAIYIVKHERGQEQAATFNPYSFGGVTMNKTYETLDEYLDDLDQIKERVADETKGMDAKQVRAYFARARLELEKITGRKVRGPRTGRKLRRASP
jgi:hypothetical protein